MGAQDDDNTPRASDGAADHAADGLAADEADSAAGRERGARRRARGRAGVAVVMVLCGVLFASTARLAGGGSIRDESGDVVGVLQERGREIEDLTADNSAKRDEIEKLR